MKKRPFGTEYLGTYTIRTIVPWYKRLWRWLAGPPPWTPKAPEMIVTEVDHDKSVITIGEKED